ncbi:hypothetical protein HF086_010585 [Spodoptera exigua]|uniref:ZAD domain-containing protein n=1 Tax=Spodoptera exigua TaxID=7107 RepID=A0A922MUL0_SPOEX|nr:hypothetical protein HF086_010585 [Spodoptera exigua]
MDWQLTCRVCLESGDMVSLFDWDENNEQLGDKYTYCCGIEVSKNDSLPTLICLHCVDRLTFAYQFKQQCLSSNDTLKECLEEFKKSSEAVSGAASSKGATETETITIKQENGLLLQYELPVEHDPQGQWTRTLVKTPNSAVVTKAPGPRKRGRPRKYPNEQGQIDMPRNYRPKPGAKSLKKHDVAIINQALLDISAGNTSIRRVAEKYGISYSVLQRRINKSVKPHGGQTAMTPEAEAFIVKNLNICADWGYPLDRNDLRYIVKLYLDTSNITVKRFKNNYPGPDFVESFLKRHSDKISKRISQNIKRSRAEVSPEMMKTYFAELEKSLEGVPHSNIVNYDETNLSDDPGRPKVIVRRGCKYPERVRNFSKGCTSLMIAANAEGELLAPYVVYKSTYLNDTWIQNGPKGTCYNRSQSGWFDGEIFSDWIRNVIIPYFDTKNGKKLLIGDNLSSHLSAHLIDLCKEKDIHFVFLPPNSTHLTQPLDVAFFRPMKQAWRSILQKWKETDGRNLSSIPKGCFPRLLKLLIDQLNINANSNIRAGFKKTGIVPLNSEEVISRLPNAEINETAQMLWTSHL